MEKITREESKKSGGQFYFTGESCKHGHISKRYTSNTVCYVCRENKKEQESKNAKQWREKNPDRYKEKKKIWSDNNKDRKYLHDKKYREKNAEKIKSRKDNWYAENSNEYLEGRKKYYKNNKELFCVFSHNRRALKKGNGGTHTVKQAQLLLESQNYKCVNCKCCLKENKKHKDHIMPLKLGGTNNIENIQWLCEKCNLSKRDKDPIKWAQQNGRLL